MTDLENELANTSALSARERELLEPPKPVTHAESHRTTLLEEMLADEAFDRHNRLRVIELTHLEPSELARYVDETCKGDPRHDLVSYLTEGIDELPFEARPKLCRLMRRLLVGEITIEEQCTLNEFLVKAMLAQGLHNVKYALEQARRRVRA